MLIQCPGRIDTNIQVHVDVVAGGLLAQAEIGGFDQEHRRVAPAGCHC